MLSPSQCLWESPVHLLLSTLMSSPTQSPHIVLVSPCLPLSLIIFNCHGGLLHRMDRSMSQAITDN